MVATSGSTDLKLRAFPFFARKGPTKRPTAVDEPVYPCSLISRYIRLRTATSLVPPLDEIVFVGVNEPSASKIYSRPLWWLLHLKVVLDRLAAYPKLASHVGYINLFRCQIVDLVVEFDSLLVQTLTLFFRVLCHSSMPGS